MAQRVIWSSSAEKDLQQILEYWIHRNKSTRYSKRLLSLFIDYSKLLQRKNNIGKPTDVLNVRQGVIGDFSMFYEVAPTEIYILRIWDNRQNPESLKIK